ncbi:MAG TPA: exosortase/archaeosortase family protein, partial [Candidatus Acidoferrales bacterium]|nr:exosortase/archaeosortase family protein [Candidatus Acidoferrales bacterium]
RVWTGSSPRSAAALLLAGALLFSMSGRLGQLIPGDDPLPFAILALVLLVWAGILFFFGAATFFAFQFPFVFLLLAVPLPKFIVDNCIEWLRGGSAVVTHLLFRLTGTPVLRNGYTFSVPGAVIDIAPECSGVRSALAMFVTCLLAGYLFLRKGWSRTVLLLFTVPMLVIKNGIRIVTLTLLAIHVDPMFLTGRPHHEGGFVFFIIGLLILWPVLLWLQKTENKRYGVPGARPRPADPIPAAPA